MPVSELLVILLASGIIFRVFSEAIKDQQAYKKWLIRYERLLKEQGK